MNFSVTIPASAIAFIEKLPGSIFSISHLGETGDPNIVIDDDGVVTNLGPDDPPFMSILDADDDSVPDMEDNCTLQSNADQLDTDDDCYGNLCDGDLNDDGSTNTLDLNIYKGLHRKPPGPSCCAP